MSNGNIQEEEEENLEDQVGIIETIPNEAADPPDVIKAKIPKYIRAKYELLSYRHAAVILAETRSAEVADLWGALRSFSVTKEMIRKAGGNESEMPKLFTASLRPKGWHETVISADLVIRSVNKWESLRRARERGSLDL